MNTHLKAFSVAMAVVALLCCQWGLGRTPAHAVVGTSQPSKWAASCSSSRLGIDNDAVALAPVIAGDRRPDGTPVRSVPDSTGHWYPIVMVHGWTGSDAVRSASDRSGAFSHLIDLSSRPPYSASVTRSLLGQLQDLPGAAVFTFDYHPYSARWVDDQHLGPALGKLIDCLYKASGQKVIVVAHSMGGLVARWAATHPGVAGTNRAGEISTAVTFGTPETGSVAAMLAAGGLDVGAGTSKALAVIRLILSACGKLATKEIKTGTLCDTLPEPARAFSSSAGIALRAGSSQLAALKPWPREIHLEALAGNTTFEVGGGWFAFPWETKKVTGAGDMIVTPDSALAGASETEKTSCDYQLNPVRGAVDTIGISIGLVANSDAARQPLGSFSGACFHPHLMRGIELTNDALGTVHDDLTRRAQAYQDTRATVVTKVWPSASSGWTINHWDENPCLDPTSGAESTYPSVYGSRADEFSCGSTASSLLACRQSGTTVTCLQSYTAKTGVTFTRDESLPPRYDVSATPSPLQVTLTDGTVCDLSLHDQAQHYQDRRSWLWCSDDGNKALLTDEATDSAYFDKSKPQWTAEYDSGEKPPTTIGVRSVVYAQ